MLGSPLFAGKCCRILVVCHEFHLPTLEVSLKFIAKMVLSDLNQKIRSALAKVKRLAATCTWGGDQNCQQHPACQVSEDERKGFSEMIEGGGTGHGNYRPLVELLTSFHQSLTGMNVVSESLREPPRFQPFTPTPATSKVLRVALMVTWFPRNSSRLVSKRKCISNSFLDLRQYCKLFDYIHVPAHQRIYWDA